MCSKKIFFSCQKMIVQISSWHCEYSIRRGRVRSSAGVWDCDQFSCWSVNKLASNLASLQVWLDWFFFRLEELSSMLLNGSQWPLSVTSATSRNSARKKEIGFNLSPLQSLFSGTLSLTFTHSYILSSTKVKPSCFKWLHPKWRSSAIGPTHRWWFTTTILISTRLIQECEQLEGRRSKTMSLPPSQSSLIASV